MGPLRPPPLIRAATSEDEPLRSDARLHDPVAEMRHARSVHDAGKFQFHAASLDPINQASAASEHDWHQRDCQLVQEARP